MKHTPEYSELRFHWGLVLNTRCAACGTEEENVWWDDDTQEITGACYWPDLKGECPGETVPLPEDSN